MFAQADGHIVIVTKSFTGTSGVYQSTEPVDPNPSPATAVALRASPQGEAVAFGPHSNDIYVFGEGQGAAISVLIVARIQRPVFRASRRRSDAWSMPTQKREHAAAPPFI